VNAIVLRAITRCPVARQFEADEIRHHAAAGEIATGGRTIAHKVGEPADSAAFDGDSGGANGVGAEVLVEDRTEEVSDYTNRVRRGRDEAHIARMTHVRAIGKEFCLDFGEHGVGRGG
jgi:hypothetical protein